MIDTEYGLESDITLPAGEDGCCDFLYGIRTYWCSGSDEASVNIGKIEKYEIPHANRDGLQTFRITGIPEGGPYFLTITCGDTSIDYSGIYVRRENSSLPAPPHLTGGFSKERKEGAQIIRGIKDGAVLQRNEDNVCEIEMVLLGEGDVRVSFDGAYAEETGKDGFNKARVFTLKGIPTGGPYAFSIFIGNDEIKLRDIYVGDNWLCGGQSNMEANAREDDTDRKETKNSKIRFLSPDNEWGEATPVLKGYNGVSPAYYFAKKMYEYTSVPQGILMYAFGGSPLYTWMPFENPLNYAGKYCRLLKRAYLGGRKISGIFWYQGEAEAQRPACQNVYFTEMPRFISSIRKETFCPDAPFVQAQVFKMFTNEPWEEMDTWWTRMRAKQLQLENIVNRADAVATSNSSTEDGLHLISESQRTVGRSAAESMMHMLHPENAGYLPYIRVDKVSIGDGHVYVKFRNLHGNLVSSGHANGFSLTQSESMLTGMSPFRVDLKGDTADLFCGYGVSDMRLQKLYYAFGNRYYCNITDEAGRPLPAFGPINLSDAEEIKN